MAKFNPKDTVKCGVMPKMTFEVTDTDTCGIVKLRVIGDIDGIDSIDRECEIHQDSLELCERPEDSNERYHKAITAILNVANDPTRSKDKMKENLEYLNEEINKQLIAFKNL